jgi:hypothetical protein
MGWVTRLARYMRQNDAERVQLKPGQLRRWRKKANAEGRRVREAAGARETGA